MVYMSRSCFFFIHFSGLLHLDVGRWRVDLLQVSMSCYETFWRRLEPVSMICRCGASLCAEAAPVLLTGHWRTRLMSSSHRFSLMNWSVLNANITASWTVHVNCTEMKEAGQDSTEGLVRVCCGQSLPTQ